MQQCAQCSRGAPASAHRFLIQQQQQQQHQHQQRQQLHKQPWSRQSTSHTSDLPADSVRSRRRLRLALLGHARVPFAAGEDTLQSTPGLADEQDRVAGPSSAYKAPTRRSTRILGHQHRAQMHAQGSSRREFMTSAANKRVDSSSQQPEIEGRRPEELHTQAKFHPPTSKSGKSQDSKSDTKSSSAYQTNCSRNDLLRREPQNEEGAAPKASSTAKSTSSKTSPPGLYHLTDEVVQPSSEAGKQPLDEINALLAYPTLYDPIRKPRNPLVLCHGLYGFDTWGLDILPALRVHYWGDVLAVLRGIVEINPIVVGVPGTGSITQRAEQLHKALCKQEDVAGKEVNLVGHSMGGLDSRHLVSNIRPTEYHPVSLTTIATPHRGSPFMSWCRANIGIGDIAKAAAKASQGKSEAGDTSSLADSDLPYSLKTPLFSRSKWLDKSDDKQDTERPAPSSDNTDSNDLAAASQQTSKASKKDAIAKAFINVPGLNFTLGTSLASYLLDLLDSPAYSNLTPEFLASEFNPSTPDRPDIRYFSVAARARKLSLAHPLWLPKTIVDKAQDLEKSKDSQLGRQRPSGWQWGNDGLVPVESAKWGEFLGVIENADHWSIRGGAGFQSSIKDAKDRKKLTEVSSGDDATSRKSKVEDHEEKDSDRSRLVELSAKAKSALSSAAESATVHSAMPSFSWSDINSAVSSGINALDTSPKGNGEREGAKKSQTRDNDEGAEQAPPTTTNANKDALKSLSSVANWIVKRIPLVSNNDKQLRSSIDPAYPYNDAETAKISSQSKAAPTRSLSDSARLLFGAGASSNGSGKNASKQKDEVAKFNHERFYIALCKKLYDEGM